MGVIRFVVRLIGWLVTIILQVAVSYLIILLFSFVFAGADTTSQLGWLLLSFMIWLGYIIGINLVGLAALRWVWQGVRLLPIPRLIGTAIGALIPLIILVIIGYSVPLGDAGTRYYDLVTNNWSPILVQAALFAAIVGYYVPGLMKQKVSQ